MTPQIQKLQRTRKWLETVHERVIQQNDDRVVVVIGDEGVGKSTFMLQLAGFWQDIRGEATNPESVMSQLVWGGRPEFNEALRSWDEGSMIAVQDAAHVLFSKEAMHGEQIETEKNLLDIRVQNFLIVLGFQDFGDLPSGLANRRAKNAFYLPTRGSVHGFNRASMDERLKSGEWPEPDFEDRFPSLEGTALWEQFSSRDREAKLERISATEEESVEDAQRKEAIKTVVRAVKPWSDDEGMTQVDAADLVGYSASWVSKRMREWHKGRHRGLLDDDPTVPNQVTDKENQQAASGQAG